MVLWPSTVSRSKTSSLVSYWLLSRPRVMKGDEGQLLRCDLSRFNVLALLAYSCKCTKQSRCTHPSSSRRIVSSKYWANHATTRSACHVISCPCDFCVGKV